MPMRLIRTLFARAVRGASDGKLERRFGGRLAQRVMFRAMASQFDPDAAGDFEGDISYELQRPAPGAPPLRGTIAVSGRRARARPGSGEEAALKLRLNLADFVRIG